jgi:hypothetical protein
MSRYITKVMNLKKPKRLVMWDGREYQRRWN